MSGITVDPAIKEIFARFFDAEPVSFRIIDTGRGEEDFRETAIVTTDDDEKYVLKIASNDFTFPARIRMWQRTVGEYRALGYYCPRILCDRHGDLPVIGYKSRKCAVWGEEFSRYKPLEDRAADDGPREETDTAPYFEDIWRMTARIAAKKLDYTDHPSGYCLFETFCPSDRTDEVTENALEWKRCADALPEGFSAQVRRIWDLWNVNRESLRRLYAKLPSSVFQADLNPTNLLVDDEGRFRGVYDFNLCGRDVFLNYLMREIFWDFEKEIDMIRRALSIAREHYVFSEDEKRAVLPLYRCLKPLWYTRVEDLRQAGDDRGEIRRCLDRTEHYLTADIDFESFMG